MEQHHILLIEFDSEAIKLIESVLQESNHKVQLHVVRDGAQALAFLRKQGDYVQAKRPDIVLLELDLPHKDGRETLAEIKQDQGLRSVPVIVFTRSLSERDIAYAYAHQANSYIAKPADVDEFVRVLEILSNYWLDTVRLPRSS